MADLSNPPEVPTVDAKQAAELVLEQEAPYLDVRTPEEFAMGHVEGSINLPYLFFKPDGSRELNKDFVEQATAALPADKQAQVVVSCQTGRRGALATKALQDSGYIKIVNLGGGLTGWTDAGLPTTK